MNKTMIEMRRFQNNNRGLLQLIFAKILCVVLVICYPKSVQAYTNYTVGDSLGWYDSTEKLDINYQKWADGKNFSLGDFLIFNTNTNHSVIQTYNATVYKLCDNSDASDSDTIEWSSANPSNTATQPVTVSVPLLKEGKTFFFSSDYDGDQCISGQRFAITVSHGQGLPKSLQDPSDDTLGPAAGPQPGGDDDNSVPDTNVPANFDHPKEAKDSGDDEEKRKDSSSATRTVSFWSFLVLFLGFVWMV